MSERDIPHRETGKPASEPQAKSESILKGDPFGCMRGTITIMPHVDLTTSSGDPWNADLGQFLNE